MAEMVLRLLNLRQMHNPEKKIYPTHVKVPAGTGGLRMESIVICEQVRAISKTRLKDVLGKFDKSVMTSIEAALKIALDLP